MTEKRNLSQTTPRQTDVMPSPFGSAMVDLRQTIDRLFDDFTRGSLPWAPSSQLFGGGGAMPRLDVRETADTIIVEAEVPGMKPEEISLSIADDVLTISGETRSEETREQEQMRWSERRYGHFTRSVRLPPAIDREKVDAAYDNGLLRITVPKTEAASDSSRKIEIRKA